MAASLVSPAKDAKIRRHLFIVVAALHAALIFSVLAPISSRKQQPKKKLIVREATAPKISAASTPKATVVAKSKTPSIAPPAASKKPAVAPSAATQKPHVEKKPTPIKPQINNPAKSQVASKNSITAPSKTSEHLHELEQRIHQIQDRQKKRAAAADFKTSSWQHEATYADTTTSESSLETIESELLSFLQGHLNLPDYGEVKVKVTINPYGTIEKCTVLFSESDKNKHYIIAELQNMTLPLTKKSLSLKSSSTFVLTFCNQI